MWEGKLFFLKKGMLEDTLTPKYIMDKEKVKLLI